jgi:hypothetical protein
VQAVERELRPQLVEPAALLLCRRREYRRARRKERIMTDFVDPLEEPLDYDRDKRSATDAFAEDWYQKELDAEREKDAEREEARAEKKAAAEKAAEKAAADEAGGPGEGDED